MSDDTARPAGSFPTTCRSTALSPKCRWYRFRSASARRCRRMRVGSPTSTTDSTRGATGSIATRGEYLAFLGRISPEKRPDRAIEIAKRAGVPLKIAAKVDPVDREYFERSIKPLLDHPLIEFIGEIDEGQKRRLPGPCAGFAVPDRLAGAVRAGHDRGDGGGHAGHRLAQRLGRRGGRGWRERPHRRLHR